MAPTSCNFYMTKSFELLLDRRYSFEAVFAWRGLGPEKLPVCRIGCGRGTRSGDLQPDRFRQTQWSRSRGLSPRRAELNRRSSIHRIDELLPWNIHSSPSEVST